MKPLPTNNTVRKVVYDHKTSDWTFFFTDSDEPFSINEFVVGSPTRTYLEGLTEYLATTLDSEDTVFPDWEGELCNL